MYPFTKSLTTDKSEVVITLPNDYFKVERSMSELIAHEVVINYTIDDNTVDDVVYNTNISNFAIVNRATFGAVNIVPTGIGKGVIVIWSRHMEATTRKTINVEVKYEQI